MSANLHSNLVDSVKEIFPNLPDIFIQNKIQSLSPEARSVENLVEYFLFNPVESSTPSSGHTSNPVSSNAEKIPVDNSKNVSELSEEPQSWNGELQDVFSSDIPNISNINKSDSRDNLAQQLKEIRNTNKQKWQNDSGKLSSGSMKHIGGSYGLNQQLKDARKKQNSQWRSTQLEKKKTWTLSDLDSQKQLEQETNADWGGGQIHTENVAIGKKALELTNNFRKQNGLRPLKWHQSLCEIGAKHSKDMA